MFSQKQYVSKFLSYKEDQKIAQKECDRNFLRQKNPIRNSHKPQNSSILIENRFVPRKQSLSHSFWAILGSIVYTTYMTDKAESGQCIPYHIP